MLQLVVCGRSVIGLELHLVWHRQTTPHLACMWLPQGIIKVWQHAFCYLLADFTLCFSSDYYSYVHVHTRWNWTVKMLHESVATTQGRKGMVRVIVSLCKYWYSVIELRVTAVSTRSLYTRIPTPLHLCTARRWSVILVIFNILCITYFPYSLWLTYEQGVSLNVVLLV